MSFWFKVLIFFLGIIFNSCATNKIIENKCFMYSHQTINLEKIDNKIIKKQLPLIHKLGNTSYDGKVKSAYFDKVKKKYLIFLQNKKSNYCIKTFESWEVDSVIVLLPKMY